MHAEQCHAVISTTTTAKILYRTLYSYDTHNEHNNDNNTPTVNTYGNHILIHTSFGLCSVVFDAYNTRDSHERLTPVMESL